MIYNLHKHKNFISSSSWAFAAVGAIESAYAIKTGKLVSFSEEDLLNCYKNSSECPLGSIDSG